MTATNNNNIMYNINVLGFGGRAPAQVCSVAEKGFSTKRHGNKILKTKTGKILFDPCRK
jgi:hypothetical protein